MKTKKKKIKKGSSLTKLYLTPKLEKLSKAKSQEEQIKMIYNWTQSGKLEFKEFVELILGVLSDA